MQKKSMFEKYVILRDPEQIYKCSYMSDFMKNLNDILHDGVKTDDQKQREIFKVFVIVTLRQIFVKLVQSIHLAESQDSQYGSMSIVVNGVTKVIDNHIKSLDVTENKEAKGTRVVTEFLTEFMANLADEDKVLQQRYKAEITTMFNEEKFFLLHERILKQWQYIMRQFLEEETKEVFDEQLLKFNRVEGFLITKKAEIMHKSLTFKRLAFLVYSSKTDQFDETQLDNLLKKMTEGFKNQDKNEDMKQQLFLLSRILMLRLTTSQLEDALRKLWPHLLNELV